MDFTHEAGLIREAINKGNRIEAIKLVRMVASCGLLEAKAIVDATWPQEKNTENKFLLVSQSDGDDKWAWRVSVFNGAYARTDAMLHAENCVKQGTSAYVVEVVAESKLQLVQV